MLRSKFAFWSVLLAAFAGTLAVMGTISGVAFGRETQAPASLPFRSYSPLLASDSGVAVATPVAPSPSATAPAGLTPAPAQPSTLDDVTVTKRPGSVTRGTTAAITIHTTPGAGCSIEYVTPSGNRSTADGLGDQTADADGNVTWSWRIAANSAFGTGVVDVTCGAATVTTTFYVV